MFSERFEQAIRLCLRAHHGQVRKAEPNIPYATHPIHVSFLVIQSGGDEDCAIAALLHDLLEDTDVTGEDLEAAFGRRITQIVREVSEDKNLPWEIRKSRMVEQLRSASPEACLVAAADKLHNLETLLSAERKFGARTWDAFRKGPEETVRFYTDAIDSLAGRIPQELETACRKTLDLALRRVAGDDDQKSA